MGSMVSLTGAVHLQGPQLNDGEVPDVERVLLPLEEQAEEPAGFRRARDARTPDSVAPVADGCTCGECTRGCAAALARPCCGACMSMDWDQS